MLNILDRSKMAGCHGWMILALITQRKWINKKSGVSLGNISLSVSSASLDSHPYVPEIQADHDVIVYMCGTQTNEQKNGFLRPKQTIN